MLAHLSVRASVLGLLLASAVACSGQSDELGHLGTSPTSEETTAPSASPEQSEPGDSFATIEGQVERLSSLRAMVETYKTIVFGTVLPGEEVRYREDYPGAICPLPYTIYTIKVESIVHTQSEALPDRLPVAIQRGPPHDSRCGGSSEPEVYGLIAGQRLLLLANDQTENGIEGFVGDIFRVGEDNRLIPNGSEAFNAGPADLVGVSAEEVRSALLAPDPESAVRDLARNTVEEATAKLMAAINEAPLPAIPVWLQPYVSPTPTPSPAPAPPAEDAGAIEPGPAAE